MYRNQYLAVSSKPKSTFLNIDPVCSSGLHIYASPFLDVSSSQYLGAEVTILGHVIDPMRPTMTNAEIVVYLAQSCASLENVFKEIQALSGRYVVVYKNETCFVAIGDACNLRQMYYCFRDGNLILTSSPKLFLEYLDDDLRMSESKKKFTELPEYKRQESAWYGDKSFDDRLQKVLPNHYLDIFKKESRRIPFLSSPEFSNEEEVVDYVSSMLAGTYSSLLARYRLLQPLTAGWDTRVLLAASKKVKDEIQFYVFDRRDGRPPPADTWVSMNLSRALGLRFNMVSPEPLRGPFLEEYKRGHLEPRILPKTRNIQHHYDMHYDKDTVNVNGNAAEVARCFYGHTERAVTLNMLLTFTGYGEKSAFITNELRLWYTEATEWARSQAINLLDLFYWEQRMGNWGALYPFEQDIAIEEISPFNNRSLLYSLLQAKGKRRRGPHYPLFRTLTQHLWADTLLEPINPDQGHIKALLKSSSTTRYWATKSKQFMESILSWGRRTSKTGAP